MPVTSVSDVTGFPEMMDGRVKTLHPKVHGGILARRHEPDDLAAAGREGIGLIDVVAVNLYPFARTAADPSAPFDHLIEQIDIGGPSLVRAAAKNFRDVLRRGRSGRLPGGAGRARRAGGPTPAFRFDLARRAFAHTAAYDTTIAAGARHGRPTTRASHRRAVALPLAPARLVVEAAKLRDLRYGENPHQPAAWYAVGDGPGLGAATVVQGKELSYTNLLDLDAAARIVLEFDEPAAAVIKHTNPCGVATGGARRRGLRRRARRRRARRPSAASSGSTARSTPTTARALTVDLHRSGRGPGGGRRRPADARRQAEPAGAGDGHRGLPPPAVGGLTRASCARCSAGCSSRRATS